MTRFARSLLVAMATLIALSACKEEKVEVMEPVIRPVKYVVIGDAERARGLEFPGSVQAQQRVDLAFQVSGLIKSLDAKEGTAFKKGDVIARLDQRDFKANRNAAKAQYAQAVAAYKRGKQLIKKKYISTAEYDKLRAQRDVAKADLERAKKALSDATLIAPFSGVITRRFVENFTDIQAKQAVVSLQNVDHLEIVLNVPERIFAAHHEGDKLTIWAEFSGYRDEKIALSVKETALEADPVTRTYRVTMNMDQPKSFTALPGMTGKVFVQQDLSADDSLRVPVTAVYADVTGGDKQYIWLIDDKLVVHAQHVNVGGMMGRDIVINSGVARGDKVVTAGVHALSEGQQIRLLDGKIGE